MIEIYTPMSLLPSEISCTLTRKVIIWSTYSFNLPIFSLINFTNKVKWKQFKNEQHAYYVPTTLFVLVSLPFPPKILAKPKSDIFGFISESNKILLALRSLWIILNRESSWRYSSPRAIPMTMFWRLLQSSWARFLTSV